MEWKTGFDEPFLVVASDVGAWVSVTPNAGSISISVLKWRPFYETSVGKEYVPHFNCSFWKCTDRCILNSICHFEVK
jgi:hypothetical protein